MPGRKAAALTAGIALAAGLAVAACVSPIPPSPSPVAPSTDQRPSAPSSAGPSSNPATADPTAPAFQPSIDPAMVQGVMVRCGSDSPPLPAEVLWQPGSAEAGSDEAAMILRGELGVPVGAGGLPATGWRRIDVSPTQVLFVAPSPDGWSMVLATRGPSGWFADLSGACQLRPVFPNGVGEASWWIDPSRPRPGPESTTIDGLVLELACASGRAPIGRIVGPDIKDLPDGVIVTFGVRPLAGGQDCPGNPPSRATFELPTPLGTRPLFDGGEFPPRDATVPAP